MICMEDRIIRFTFSYSFTQSCHSQAVEAKCVLANQIAEEKKSMQVDKVPRKKHGQPLDMRGEIYDV